MNEVKRKTIVDDVRRFSREGVPVPKRNNVKQRKCRLTGIVDNTYIKRNGEEDMASCCQPKAIKSRQSTKDSYIKTNNEPIPIIANTKAVLQGMDYTCTC